MNSAADLSGMFIVRDVTVCAYKYGRCKTLAHLSSELGKGAQPVCLFSVMVIR